MSAGQPVDRRAFEQENCSRGYEPRTAVPASESGSQPALRLSKGRPWQVTPRCPAQRVLMTVRLASICTLVVVAVSAQSSGTRPPQKYEALGRAILGELIAVDTTVDHGSTVAAKAVAARAMANGFPQADVT